MNPVRAPSLTCSLLEQKLEKKDQHCISSHPQWWQKKKKSCLINSVLRRVRTLALPNGKTFSHPRRSSRHSPTSPQVLPPIATSHRRRKLQLLHFTNCWDNSSTVGLWTPLSRCSDKMVWQWAFKVKELGTPEHLLNDSFRSLHESTEGNWHFHINVSTG